MQRAARLAHVLRRGAERGRGAAAGRERREQPCNHERRRENTYCNARRGRLTRCDAAPSGGKGRRQESKCQCNWEWRQGQTTTRDAAGLPADAKRGRGEAAMGREWRCGQEQQRARAVHSAGTAGSHATMRRRAWVKGDGERKGREWRFCHERSRAHYKRAVRPAHRLRRGEARGGGKGSVSGVSKQFNRSVIRHNQLTGCGAQIRSR
jgi:hypothetical protein